jgi:hypothetical protein
VTVVASEDFSGFAVFAHPFKRCARPARAPIVAKTKLIARDRAFRCTISAMAGIKASPTSHLPLSCPFEDLQLNQQDVRKFLTLGIPDIF